MSEKNYRGLSKHVHEVRPRKDHRGVDLISDALPFAVGGRAAGQTRPATPLITRNSIAAHNNAVIRVYEDADNLIETQEHNGDFKEP